MTRRHSRRSGRIITWQAARRALVFRPCWRTPGYWPTRPLSRGLGRLDPAPADIACAHTTPRTVPPPPMLPAPSSGAVGSGTTAHAHLALVLRFVGLAGGRAHPSGRVPREGRPGVAGAGRRHRCAVCWRTSRWPLQGKSYVRPAVSRQVCWKSVSRPTAGTSCHALNRPAVKPCIPERRQAGAFAGRPWWCRQDSARRRPLERRGGLPRGPWCARPPESGESRHRR